MHLVGPALQWWNEFFLPVTENSCSLAHQHICHWFTLPVCEHMAEGVPECWEGHDMATNLWWVPPSMVWFVSRADPPSACHLSAGNMLSLLQGPQCVWYKQAPEPCPLTWLARRQPCQQEGIGSYMKPQNVGVKYIGSPVRYPWVAFLLLHGPTP